MLLTGMQTFWPDLSDGHFIVEFFTRSVSVILSTPCKHQGEAQILTEIPRHIAAHSTPATVY